MCNLIPLKCLRLYGSFPNIVSVVQKSCFSGCIFFWHLCVRSICFSQVTYFFHKLAVLFTSAQFGNTIGSHHAIVKLLTTIQWLAETIRANKVKSTGKGIPQPGSD